jgi:hypothetical protein
VQWRSRPARSTADSAAHGRTRHDIRGDNDRRASPAKRAVARRERRRGQPSAHC